jgi:phosphoribosylformylglycinamidine cyclo-ligase
MVVIVAEDLVDPVTTELEGAGETVLRIGRIESGQRGCTVSGPAGSWGESEDWIADHDA